MNSTVCKIWLHVIVEKYKSQKASFLLRAVSTCLGILWSAEVCWGLPGSAEVCKGWLGLLGSA